MAASIRCIKSADCGRATSSEAPSLSTEPEASGHSAVFPLLNRSTAAEASYRTASLLSSNIGMIAFSNQGSSLLATANTATFEQATSYRRRLWLKLRRFSRHDLWQALSPQPRVRACGRPCWLA